MKKSFSLSSEAVTKLFTVSAIDEGAAGTSKVLIVCCADSEWEALRMFRLRFGEHLNPAMHYGVEQQVIAMLGDVLSPAFAAEPHRGTRIIAEARIHRHAQAAT